MPTTQPEQVTTGSDRLLNKAELAELLAVPEFWVRNAVTARRIPFVKVGKHVRFTPAHVALILADGEQPPVTRSRKRV